MDYRGEIVVGQHHHRCFLGRFRAFLAHRHADIGAFEGGSIVHAVAGHGDDLALGLQRLHQAQLVFRAGAGEHVDVPRRAGQGAFGQGFDLGSQHRHLALADSQLLADGAGGDAMVAGNHLHTDAGGMAERDGFDGLLAGRVDQAAQAEQRKPFRHAWMVH